ncbi:MAG: ABC transporter ATP-binding protein [Clostridia bacterium]|nr:ABC transporter ATP-binding protein [Clostridia bacterium]
MSLLEIKKLNVSYSNHYALEDIDLKIDEGEYVCLVGENGSGKSTLVKTIVGLKKQDSGTINLNIELGKVSYLAQFNLKDLNFPATAKEIIMTGTQKHGKLPFYSKKDKEVYKRVIEQLHIEDLQNRRIGDLSGGQKQRVLIARALISEPELLILDEPTAGLDYNITQEFYKILKQLNKENKLTIIMATHDIEELANDKPRIVYLSKKVVYDGNYDGWKGYEK